MRRPALAEERKVAAVAVARSDGAWMVFNSRDQNVRVIEHGLIRQDHRLAGSPQRAPRRPACRMRATRGDRGLGDLPWTPTSEEGGL